MISSAEYPLICCALAFQLFTFPPGSSKNVAITELTTSCVIWPYCQGLEYVYSNAAFRLPQTDTGTVLCVPGPIGLFRRSALDQVHALYGLLKPGHPPGGPSLHPADYDVFDYTLTHAALVTKPGGVPAPKAEGNNP